MVFTRAQAASRENEEEEESTEEAVDIYDFWDKRSDPDHVEKMEDTPVPIKMTEILDAQRVDDFCEEILARKDRGTSWIVETEDGVLRRAHPDNEGDLQIVMPKVLRPRLLNITHH